MNFYTTFNSFAPAFYYDNNESLSELQDFPPSDEPVYILGIKYSSLHELDDIRNDVRTKIWSTYRRNFPSIGDSGMTTDSGWGCMLRAGQMVLAQAFCNYHLGRNWKWDYSNQSSIQKLLNDNTESSAKEFENYCKYREILKLFSDLKTATYSIHQIALMGACEGKNVGEWFGPNTIAQVLKKLSVYDKYNDFYIHIAMDNMVFTDDIKKLCKSRVRIGTKVSLSNNDNDLANEKWRPLVLFIPLRLGLTDINPVYFRALKSSFAFPQSLGILGGRPNHALYFIGCCGDSLVYLDPHTTQPALTLDNDICQRQQSEAAHSNNDYNIENEDFPADETDSSTSSSIDFESDDISYHCERASRMPITYLDPSIALCFLCKTEEEFDHWANLTLRKLIQEEKQPLFEIMKERPGNWPSLEDDIEMDALSLNDSSNKSNNNNSQSKLPKSTAGSHNPDTFTDLEEDEDYEIIDY